MDTENYQIKRVESKRDLKQWVCFQLDHYRSCPQFVPPLISEEIDTFSGKNPVKKIADFELFVALDGHKPIGRIAAIVHHLEEKKLGYRRGRFGWFECIDDSSASRLLLDAAKNWLVSQNCVEMTGPHGFTDLDPEGLLIEGFQETPTIGGSYHYPFYQKLIAEYGFQKDADYVEFQVPLPMPEPALFEKLRKRYEDKMPYVVKSCESKKELLSIAPQFWAILEESFEKLYGVTPLTSQQSEYYTKRYLSFLDPEFMQIAVSKESGKLVAFFLAMPGLSTAFQKAKGKLLPFGFWHLLRQSQKPTSMDFLLAGVKPGHPTSLLVSFLSMQIYQVARKRGIQYFETNRELETNKTVNGIWSSFNGRLHRRSRVYKLELQAKKESP